MRPSRRPAIRRKAAPFSFAEAKLLSPEPVAPTEECWALAAKRQPDEAFEDIHHRQLREIVQRVADTISAERPGAVQRLTSTQ